ncbi:hypothetical protein NXX23_09885 [Bacteroides ovatus]|nr:hypothetical protein [Bacteroides ovatus]
MELYEKYGINRMLKKSFRRQGETETMKYHSFRGTTEVKPGFLNVNLRRSGETPNS